MKIEEIPNWIDTTTRLTDDRFKKIFIFFVINFPVPKKSARAITLPDDVAIPIKYKVAEKASEMEDMLVNNNLEPFPPNADFEERAVFTRSQNTVVLSFINHIRNSIAHGRFNIIQNREEGILVMEDMNKNKECSARVVVKTNTLTKWIDGIK